MPPEQLAGKIEATKSDGSSCYRLLVQCSVLHIWVRVYFIFEGTGRRMGPYAIPMHWGLTARGLDCWFVERSVCLLLMTDTFSIQHAPAASGRATGEDTS